MDFPIALGCFLKTGYKNVAQQGKKYLGDKSRLDLYPRVVVDFLIKDDASVTALEDWWKNDINNGLDSFNITVPFFGDEKAYEADVIGNLEVNWQEEGYLAKFTLRILGPAIP